LFDGVASLIGLRHVTTFEGQAAMELEFALSGVDTNESYPFDTVRESAGAVVDWAPMIRSILSDIEKRVPTAVVSAKFHNTLAEMITRMALELGEERVVLTGGCFQNRYLTEKSVTRLERAGLHPYWHQRIPPNDGGIALGQVAAAAYLDSRGEKD
jgi:hydrogenase maturation protein HypF